MKGELLTLYELTLEAIILVAFLAGVVVGALSSRSRGKRNRDRANG